MSQQSLLSDRLRGDFSLLFFRPRPGHASSLTFFLLSSFLFFFVFFSTTRTNPNHSSRGTSSFPRDALHHSGVYISPIMARCSLFARVLPFQDNISRVCTSLIYDAKRSRATFPRFQPIKTRSAEIGTADSCSVDDGGWFRSVRKVPHHFLFFFFFGNFVISQRDRRNKSRKQFYFCQQNS